jgi:CRP-like cAMP-binding protein
MSFAKGGPEQQAIEAGEIDAIVDHGSKNIILLPAARSALREAANQASAANREAANRASVVNSVLAALPLRDHVGLLDGLEPVTLAHGTVLVEPGELIEHVYFPIDCLIYVLSTVETGQAIEVGLVGREGMVGVALVLGEDVSSVRALVQEAGTALRMTAGRFRKEFEQRVPLQRELYRYTCAMLAQARQTVVCNRFHAVEARVARWLLMTSDRSLSKEFFLTQAFLADVLGVRRAEVNEAAGALQKRKIIAYTRGKIKIVDRKSLEAAACSCYAGMRTLR